MTDILIEVGLKSGQKVAAKIGVKIATAIGSAIASNIIINKVKMKDAPITGETENYDSILRKRASRDGLISGACSVAGVAVYAIAGVGIDNSK